MKRISLELSSIASIGYQSGYQSKPRQLEMEFRQSGDVYLYFEVPVKEYEAFMAADSQNIYFKKVFTLKEYDYVVLIRGLR